MAAISPGAKERALAQELDGDLGAHGAVLAPRHAGTQVRQADVVKEGRRLDLDRAGVPLLRRDAQRPAPDAVHVVEIVRDPQVRAPSIVSRTKRSMRARRSLIPLS